MQSGHQKRLLNKAPIKALNKASKKPFHLKITWKRLGNLGWFLFGLYANSGVAQQDLTITQVEDQAGSLRTGCSIMEIALNPFGNPVGGIGIHWGKGKTCLYFEV